METSSHSARPVVPDYTKPQEQRPVNESNISKQWKPTSEVVPMQREVERDSYSSDAVAGHWADAGSVQEDRNDSLTRWRTFSSSGQDPKVSRLVGSMSVFNVVCFMQRWSSDSERQRDEGSYRQSDDSHGECCGGATGCI
jgi:hypothetical protein